MSSDLVTIGCGTIVLGLIILIMGLGVDDRINARATAMAENMAKAIVAKQDALTKARPLGAKPGEVWSLKGGGFAEIMPPDERGYLQGLGVYEEGEGPHALKFYMWRPDGTLLSTGWMGQELSMPTKKASVYGGKYPEWLND